MLSVAKCGTGGGTLAVIQVVSIETCHEASQDDGRLQQLGCRSFYEEVQLPGSHTAFEVSLLGFPCPKDTAHVRNLCRHPLPDPSPCSSTPASVRVSSSGHDICQDYGRSEKLS